MLFPKALASLYKHEQHNLSSYRLPNLEMCSSSPLFRQVDNLFTLFQSLNSVENANGILGNRKIFIACLQEINRMGLSHMDPNDFILLDGARSLNFMHRDLCLMKITALKKTVALSKTSESMATSEVSKNTSCGIIATKTQQQTRRDLKVHYNSVLKNWINHNSLHPFPTKKEKLELCEKASISEKQLNNWFTNYRRRHLRTK